MASIPVRHRHDTVLGPVYDTTGLRKWLGLTRQALAWRVRGGSRLACATEDGQLVYSAWQIRNDGTRPATGGGHEDPTAQAATPWVSGSAGEWAAGIGIE